MTFYTLHRHYCPGDYETWKYIAPIQKVAWLRKPFEYGTWGGEIRSEFEPQPGVEDACATTELLRARAAAAVDLCVVIVSLLSPAVLGIKVCNG